MSTRRVLWTLVLGGLFVGAASKAQECYKAFAIDGLPGCIWPLVFKEDTQFAPGYSHAAFHQVTVGMTADDVLRLLGAPLFKNSREQGGEEWWSWSRSRRSNSYWVRGVVLEEGRITKVVHKFYFD